MESIYSKDWQQNQAGCLAHYGHHKEKLKALFDSHGTLENILNLKHILKTSICRHNIVWILPVKSFDKLNGIYRGILAYVTWDTRYTHHNWRTSAPFRSFCVEVFQPAGHRYFFGGLLGSTVRYQTFENQGMSIDQKFCGPHLRQSWLLNTLACNILILFPIQMNAIHRP